MASPVLLVIIGVFVGGIIHARQYLMMAEWRMADRVLACNRPAR